MPPSLSVHTSDVRSVRAWGCFLGLAFVLAVACLGFGRGPDRRPSVSAELRSWVVAGWGRHLYLQVLPSGGTGVLAERVEFTSAALRDDYRSPDEPIAPRVARMTRGRALRPLTGVPDNRLEARYVITAAQARALQRDRLYARPYALLGPNSNSGLRRTMEDAGLSMPASAINAGGALGEFPGVELDPGPELPVEQWGRFGVKAPRGAPAPGTHPRAE